MNKRQLQKKRTRSLILESAKQCFMENGFLNIGQEKVIITLTKKSTGAWKKSIKHSVHMKKLGTVELKKKPGNGYLNILKS